MWTTETSNQMLAGAQVRPGGDQSSCVGEAAAHVPRLPCQILTSSDAHECRNYVNFEMPFLCTGSSRRRRRRTSGLRCRRRCGDGCTRPMLPASRRSLQTLQHASRRARRCAAACCRYAEVSKSEPISLQSEICNAGCSSCIGPGGTLLCCDRSALCVARSTCRLPHATRLEGFAIPKKKELDALLQQGRGRGCPVGNWTLPRWAWMIYTTLSL